VRMLGNAFAVEEDEAQPVKHESDERRNNDFKNRHVRRQIFFGEPEVESGFFLHCG